MAAKKAIKQGLNQLNSQKTPAIKCHSKSFLKELDLKVKYNEELTVEQQIMPN